MASTAVTVLKGLSDCCVGYFIRKVTIEQPRDRRNSPEGLYARPVSRFEDVVGLPLKKWKPLFLSKGGRLLWDRGQSSTPSDGKPGNIKKISQSAHYFQSAFPDLSFIPY